MINQLVYLYNEFSKAMDENKEVRVVFLDTSKAFDRVSHRGLLTKLTAVGYSKNMTDWFHSYLTNRQLGFVLGVYLLLGKNLMRAQY